MTVTDASNFVPYHGTEDLEWREYVKNDVKPTEEELKYLKLRQRLKEEIRKEMKKKSSSVRGCSQGNKKLPYDNFGSFFGPSQPAIARRIIQESKGMLDVQHLLSKVSNLHHNIKKFSASSTSGTKPHLTEIEMKVLKRKESRDYSCLLSENAELPSVPTKETSLGNFAVLNSDQPQLRSKQSIKVPNGKVSDSIKERKHDSVVCQVQHTAQPQKVYPAKKPSLTSAYTRKQPASNTNDVVQRSSHSRTPTATVEMAYEKNPGSGVLRASLSVSEQLIEVKKEYHESRKAKSTPIQQQPSLKHNVPEEHKVALSKSQPVKRKMLEQDKEFPEPPNAKVLLNHSQSSTKHKVLKEEKEYVDPKKKNLIQNQLQSSPQHRVPDMHKAPLSKSQFSTKHQIESEKDFCELNKEKVISRQPMISERQHVSSIIQRIFWGKRKRPERKDDDFDDDCMVSNFNDILKEERKSAKLARKEDEMERLRIEQEEREERLRRKAKKPKLN